MEDHQAPLSLGFSRQEYWSGLPFPSPMHVKVKSLSRVWLFTIPRTVFYQASQSMGFSRQEYWSGLPFPSPGDLPDAGIEPWTPALQAEALPSEPPGKPSPMHACMLSRFSHFWLCVTPLTAAHQASLSTEFFRQEYWSGLPFPSPQNILVLVIPYWIDGKLASSVLTNFVKFQLTQYENLNLNCLRTLEV